MTARNRLALAGFLLMLSVPAMASPAGHLDFGQPAPAASATRTVEVEMTDIAFTPKSLDVKAGETVRFVLVNKGQLLHEFNLGNAAMHAAHQKEMLEMQQSGMLTPTVGMEGLVQAMAAAAQWILIFADSTHAVVIAQVGIQGPGAARLAGVVDEVAVALRGPAGRLALQ